MSFIRRHLKYTIELNRGSNSQDDSPDTFDNGSNALELSDLRSVGTFQSLVGGNTAFGSSGMIQIWGMKPSDMAQLSTLGFYLNRYNRNKITVFAYDEGNVANASQVWVGNIYTARVNYNAMPDVSLELDCHATLDQQTQVIPGTSVSGNGDVTTMLQGIGAACDPLVKIVNKGVSAKLANHACAGSPAQQIADICMASSVCYKISDNTLTIWNNNTNVDDTTILTGPDIGMVGYTEYNMQGMDITMEFNPEVQPGRQLQIVGANNALPIPGVPGTYWINVVTHELSSEMPDGPWFTHASVSKMNMAGRV